MFGKKCLDFSSLDFFLWIGVILANTMDWCKNRQESSRNDKFAYIKNCK